MNRVTVLAVLMAAGAVALPAQVVDRKALMIALEDFTPLQGGVPIVVAGQIVGAIGVSGASSADQDQQFAQAGAAAVK
jgi:glc operon protein GlcG